MKKLLVFLAGFCFTTIVLAYQFYYDQVPITPDTWEEVDLIYTNTINGKDYTEQANLLRPVEWIKHNRLDKVGATTHLNNQLLGHDTDVTIIAIKPVKIKYDRAGNAKPVIATFITHSNDVWEYTFKNHGESQEVIYAASDHPFYSLDRHAYIPIGQFKIGEQVKSNHDNPIKFIKKTHLNQVESVYNFEVYQTHNYKIGNNTIAVHNSPCLQVPRPIRERFRNIRENFSNWWHTGNWHRVSDSSSLDNLIGEVNVAFEHDSIDVSDIPVNSQQIEYPTMELQRWLTLAENVIFDNNKLETLSISYDYLAEQWKYDKSGDIVDSTRFDKMLYVMDNRGKFYVVPEEPLVRHAALRKLNASGAGEIKFINGKMLFISFQSGSYLPTINDAMNVIDALEGIYGQDSHNFPFVWWDDISPITNHVIR